MNIFATEANFIFSIIYSASTGLPSELQEYSKQQQGKLNLYKI